MPYLNTNMNSVCILEGVYLCDSWLAISMACGMECINHNMDQILNKTRCNMQNYPSCCCGDDMGRFNHSVLPFALASGLDGGSYRSGHLVKGRWHFVDVVQSKEREDQAVKKKAKSKHLNVCATHIAATKTKQYK